MRPEVEVWERELQGQQHPNTLSRQLSEGLAVSLRNLSVASKNYGANPPARQLDHALAAQHNFRLSEAGLREALHDGRQSGGTCERAVSPGSGVNSSPNSHDACGVICPLLRHGLPDYARREDTSCARQGGVDGLYGTCGWEQAYRLCLYHARFR